jgi:hypothetical protein
MYLVCGKQSARRARDQLVALNDMDKKTQQKKQASANAPTKQAQNTHYASQANAFTAQQTHCGDCTGVCGGTGSPTPAVSMWP